MCQWRSYARRHAAAEQTNAENNLQRSKNQGHVCQPDVPTIAQRPRKSRRASCYCYSDDGKKINRTNSATVRRSEEERRKLFCRYKVLVLEEVEKPLAA